MIIGNKNALTYKDIFQYIKDNKIWLGIETANIFFTPSETENKLIPTKQVQGLTRWFTNLTHKKRHEFLETIASYKKTPERYPKYDNYNAINVDKTKDIPLDYDGVMGVPITFLDKYNPEQFEIVGCSYGYGRPDFWDENTDMSPIVNGKNIYKRLLIRPKPQKG